MGHAIFTHCPPPPFRLHPDQPSPFPALTLCTLHPSPFAAFTLCTGAYQHRRGGPRARDATRQAASPASRML
eukprot:1113313-Rhodomonas_salina.1